MDSLELLYDHYKETINHSNQMQSKRNTLFVYVCIMELLNIIMLFFPELFSQVLFAYLKANYSITIDTVSVLLPSFVWTITLYVLVRYYQTTIYIERQYTYMAKLESEISDKIKFAEFKRESTFYLSNYPKVLDIIHVFYTWIIPIAILIINTVKIALEWVAHMNCATTIFNSVICIFIIVLSCSYLCFIHPPKTDNNQ